MNGDMGFFEAVAKRQSVRYFRPDPIPREEIEKILAAGAAAPSAGNRQPWRFLVLIDHDILSTLGEEAILFRMAAMKDNGGKNDYSQDELAAFRHLAEEKTGGYFDAPVIVVVLLDENAQYPDYDDRDGPLAAGNICLAATALGYGSVYLTDTLTRELLEKVVEIPANYRYLCAIPIGRPKEMPPRKEKAPLENITWWNKVSGQ